MDTTKRTRSASRAKNRQVTRDDVAKAAGVSNAVVSYFVSGSRPVGADTAARVQAAIDELGYSPNPVASALRSGKTTTLGVVVPAINNPFYSEYALELEAAASRRGHVLIVTNSHGDPDAEALLIDRLSTRTDGIIVASVFHAPDERAQERSDVPLVWIDASGEVPGAYVSVDAESGSREAVEHLLETHGARSVTLVLGKSHRSQNDPRLVGWRTAHRERDLREGQVVTVDGTREGGYQAGLELLENAAHRPTSIFTSSDQIAVGLIRCARDLGIAIPQDVAVVSFDGIKDSSFSTPRLTTFRQPIQEMAEAAVSALLDDSPEPQGIFHGTLLIRESCGCHTPPQDREKSQ